MECVLLQQTVLKIIGRNMNEVCPKCNGFIDGWPALSRKDNKTHLCTKCGQREALEEWVQDE